MTKTLTLKVQIRKKDENLVNLRRSGIIPGIVYGSKIESKSIKMKKVEFDKIYESAGESTLIDVVIDGGEPVKAVVKDTQRNIKKHDFTHADLFLINMAEKIKAIVPLVFIGESKAEKLGGMLLRTMDEIEIECLPGDLVNNVEIDLGKLEKIGDHILVRDLDLGENVKITNDDSSMIVNVTEPKKVAEKTTEEVAAEAEVAAAKAEDAKSKEEKEKKEDKK